MEENKYIFANVKIPIEIKNNNTYEPLTEYINIEYTKCNELPKKNTQNNNFSFINNLKQIFENENKIDSESQTDNNDLSMIINDEKKEDEIQKIIIQKDEIKNNNKNKNNISFKTKIRKNNKYTLKNY